MTTVKLHHGDCLEVLRTMSDNSVDSIVTDPPYGLKFMGKKWDYDVPDVEIWVECLRVLKPGGHLLAFSGTRTQHRMACRIEDAGFEIRDMIAWVYGSGFPKSLDVSKAIDKAAGAERQRYERPAFGATFSDDNGSTYGTAISDEPVTANAKKWRGWGTALKPALEPITVARKPFKGTVAVNVLAHGTGSLNIDACRIKTAEKLQGSTIRNDIRGGAYCSGIASVGDIPAYTQHDLGRWPANLIHDGSDEVVSMFPDTGKITGGGRNNGDKFGGGYASVGEDVIGYGDAGSAARFFYCAKASKKDRNEGLDGFEMHARNGDDYRRTINTSTGIKRGDSPRANTHLTVKPVDLMRYLSRLITPLGGTVLDPFMGSGSTGKAAILEGFGFIGIERESEYIEIACARIADAQKKASAA